MKGKASAYNFWMGTLRCLRILAKASVNSAMPEVLTPGNPALKRRAISSRPLRGLDSSNTFPLRIASLILAALLIATSALAQQTQAPGDVTIATKGLPAAGLWDHYSAKLEATGGIGPYTWHKVSGSLPRNLELRDFGLIEGEVNEEGTFEITIEAIGHGDTRSKPKKLTLRVETPLTAVWSRKSQVNGQRIDGSIKVSNTTGRDFDLTFVVLAVNDIGRATALGYQHFSLKKNTRDMELPFGGTPSPGSYDVNVDVVGEELASKNIFRTRLVAPKQTIAPTL